jgi:pSer/pThr/pTyr-binding forkhead associated (FHA) protein
MIELTIRKSGETDRKVLLKGGAYTMGRADGNDIVLADAEVSRRHARLLVDRDGIVVEDLGSNNGTFVAGRQVQARPLRDGDVVEIEPFSLVVRVDVKREPRKVPTLVFTEGPEVGRRFPLDGDTIAIGRGDDQDLKLDDSGASRAHALLMRKRGGWYVRDLDSANGVFVNGQRIAEAPVELGDTVEIGTTSLRLDELAEPTRPASGGDIDLYLEDGPTDVGEPFETQPSRPVRRPSPPAPAPAPVPVPAPAPYVPPAPYVAPAPVAAPAPAPIAPQAAPHPAPPPAPAVTPGDAGDVLPYMVLGGLAIVVVALAVLALMVKGG